MVNTEECVVIIVDRGTPSVVEVPAAETTATLTGVVTHTSAEPKLITVVVAAQTAGVPTNDDGTIDSDSAKAITATIDGTEYSDGGAASFTTFPFTTTFTYTATTLALS